MDSQEDEDEEVEGSQQDGSQEEEEEGCDELKDYTFRDLGITRERPERGQFGNVFKVRLKSMVSVAACVSCIPWLVQCITRSVVQLAAHHARQQA